jgi:predicted tellurium resistance membrane protein TerC
MSGLELLLTPENVATYLTLTFLEIVLAGDNLVLIAILASRLPEGQRPLARRIGLFAAVATRILLLLSLFWLSHLETPFSVAGVTFTPRQIVFSLGGAFLIWKAAIETFTLLFGSDGSDPRVRPRYETFTWVIVQIGLFDIIFSLDSVIAAIGMANQIEIMVAAVLTATAVMVFLVNPISNFIERHQIVKVIALNLLVLIGIHLVAEAFGFHIPRAQLYAAAILIFLLQTAILWLRRQAPVLRYGIALITALGIGVFAVALINDPALARAVQERVLATWQGSTDVLSRALDQIRPILPGG